MRLSTGTTITVIGFTVILLYVIVQILTLYGVDSSIYGKYIGFYIFLLLSLFILPE